ncbi:MAG TPA: hypothetical protein VFC31_13745, partial [Candidatus Limnocylindria bacterium]|nr:hypothetical protein [Candidatus Limnocylindria bacterium]
MATGVLAYLLGLLFLYGLLGPDSTVVSLLLPALAGALFGLRGGVVGGVLSVLLTATLWQLVGFPIGDVVLRSGTGLGALTPLAVGAGFGWMRDLRRRADLERAALRREIDRCERAEAGLCAGENRAGENVLQMILKHVPVVLFAVDRKLDVVLSGSLSGG